VAVSNRLLDDWDTARGTLAWSADPLLAEACEWGELRILVHQHRAFLLSGSRDLGICHGQGMTGLDGGGFLQEPITAADPGDRQ
jgi:hypothetical protein